MSKPFYITTTLPYVNADPHVGFAMEFIRADVIARYKKSIGCEVFFNTGTDEHGQKLLTAAKEEGKEVQDYVDGYAAKFRDLKELLGITDEVHFIRTTDTHHMEAAQELWQRCDTNGYIYKKNYQTKYCIGCELEKTDSELVDGRCPIHPKMDIELRDEENYFFALSKLEEKLNALYAAKPTLIIPDFRFNEMRAFLERGLQDFSISRPASKMSWGVPVPTDESHVMYVWFDALTNYISTLGWPNDTKGLYKKFWEEGEKVQYCGKDNIRQQSLMWQAMLLAAELPTTDHVVINGFINSGGQKMSKSLGNVISPSALIEYYKPFAGELASDVLRYYVLRHGNSFEDFDMTAASVLDAYNANLANGLGNLVSRTLKMTTANSVLLEENEIAEIENVVFSSSLTESSLYYYFNQGIKNFEINKACDEVWRMIQEVDKQIQDKKPFSLIKTDPEQAKKDLKWTLSEVYRIAKMLEPLLPKTSIKIREQIKENKILEKPLFYRIDKQSPKDEGYMCL